MEFWNVKWLTCIECIRCESTDSDISLVSFLLTTRESNDVPFGRGGGGGEVGMVASVCHVGRSLWKWCLTSSGGHSSGWYASYWNAFLCLCSEVLFLEVSPGVIVNWRYIILVCPIGYAVSYSYYHEQVAITYFLGEIEDFRQFRYGWKLHGLQGHWCYRCSYNLFSWFGYKASSGWRVLMQ